MGRRALTEHHVRVDVSATNMATIDAYRSLTDEFYDRLGDDGGFNRRALLNPAIFGLLGDPANHRVLDAGCGHGYLSRLLEPPSLGSNPPKSRTGTRCGEKSCTRSESSTSSETFPGSATSGNPSTP
jgi:hypothetical protein